MKRSKQWLCALAIALGCALPGAAYGDEPADGDPFETNKSIIRLAAGSTWNADPETNTPPPPPEEIPIKPEDSSTTPEPAEPSDVTKEACELDAGCCPRVWSFVAGVEATFFWPQLSRDFLTTSLNNGDGPINLATNSQAGTVDGNLLVAPRLTLGFQGCRWGLYGRYWYADNWASGYSPTDPTSIGVGTISFDGFRAYTVDLEVQRRFYAGCWTLAGCLGARYAQVDNDRLLTGNIFSDIDAVSTRSFTTQQFSGAGLTWGFWGTRPVCCDSPLKYFVANRYSYIWGNVDAAAETNAQVINAIGDSAASFNGALASGQGNLFIAELQLGLQWDAELRCFPARAFVRGALEYQYWDVSAGVEASSNSFAFLDGVGGDTTASARDLLFNLIGITLGAGITF
jgi:hypothetical protein